MRVYVVRHAKAERARPGEPDALRRLAPKGHKQARKLREELADVRFDAVISSPLLRAGETAELVAGRPPEIDDRLAPGATAEDVRAAVAGRGDTVMIVGHNPDCPRIVADLTGGPAPEFPTCGYAIVEL
jgi:phosphohistidine phosphatase